MLKYVNLSSFLNSSVHPFILGAFFNRFLFTNNDEYIYTILSYGVSPRLTDNDNSNFDIYLNNYLNILNSIDKNYQWVKYDSEYKNLGISKPTPKGTAYLFLYNDLRIQKTSFYNRIYSKIINIDEIHGDDLNEFKKDFIRGFFELRGSADTKLGFITQDYFYNDKFECQRIKILYEYFNVPTNALNFNFRELQGQFVSGESKRNTQLRIRMKWYLQNIGMICPYKNIILSQHLEQDRQTINNVTYYINNNYDENNNSISTFEERIKYFTNSIYDKQLSDSDVEKIRQDIGFNEEDKTTIRDSSLIAVFRDNTEDKCMCCKNKYDIKDRSFINKKTDRFYFEIHHVISLGGNKELDDENNLSKLCPTCHAALKKGRAKEDYQKELIKNIYKNSPNILEFAKHYFDTDNYDDIINNTYNSLK